MNEQPLQLVELEMNGRMCLDLNNVGVELLMEGKYDEAIKAFSYSMTGIRRLVSYMEQALLPSSPMLSTKATSSHAAVDASLHFNYLEREAFSLLHKTATKSNFEKSFTPSSETVSTSCSFVEIRKLPVPEGICMDTICFRGQCVDFSDYETAAAIAIYNAAICYFNLSLLTQTNSEQIVGCKNSDAQILISSLHLRKSTALLILASQLLDEMFEEIDEDTKPRFGMVYKIIASTLLTIISTIECELVINVERMKIRLAIVGILCNNDGQGKQYFGSPAA